MRLHDAIRSIELTVQDAQKSLERVGDGDEKWQQVRVELDGLWNAVKLITVTIDDERPKVG
jgi:hypothetical protein